MAKEHQIRKVETRQARNNYKCQCSQEACQEVIEKGQEYAVFKIVEKLQGEYKNKEKKLACIVNGLKNGGSFYSYEICKKYYRSDH